MTKTTFFVLLIAGCQSGSGPLRPERRNLAGLDNVHRLGDKIMSGSEPKGEEAFRALAAIGVRTLLSVDGIRPDVETARKFGLRYVHLPFGYDGIPVDRALSIARAARDLEGPIYIHCHHGRHRGPAAAGIALLGLDRCSPEDATEFMKKLGTSEHFSGLYRSVREFRPSPGAIGAADGSFPEAAKTERLTSTMAAVDRTWDRLAAWRRDGWPADQSRESADSALSLSEMFSETGRVQGAGRSEDFMKRMEEARREASRLEEALRAKTPSEAEAASAALQASCYGCHHQHRDHAGSGR